MPSKDDEWIKKKKHNQSSKVSGVWTDCWARSIESDACFESSEEHVCLYFLSVARNRDI